MSLLIILFLLPYFFGCFAAIHKGLIWLFKIDEEGANAEFDTIAPFVISLVTIVVWMLFVMTYLFNHHYL